MIISNTAMILCDSPSTHYHAIVSIVRKACQTRPSILMGSGCYIQIESLIVPIPQLGHITLKIILACYLIIINISFQ